MAFLSFHAFLLVISAVILKCSSSGLRQCNKHLQSLPKPYQNISQPALSILASVCIELHTLTSKLFLFSFSKNFIFYRNENWNNPGGFLQNTSLAVYYIRNKTCFPCLHSLVKTKTNVCENSRAVEGFHLLENSRKLCWGFHHMETRRICFISFIKSQFSDLTKKKTIYEARLYKNIAFMKL